MASINSNLFKSWVKRAVNLSSFSALNGLLLKDSYDNNYSQQNKNAPAVIKPNILGGILALSQIQNHKDDDEKDFGGFGFTGDSLVLEIPNGDAREVAVIKDGKVYACEYSKDGGVAPYIFKEGHKDGILLIASVILCELSNGIFSSRDEEFRGEYRKAKELLKSGLAMNNIEEFGKHVAIASENLYRRLLKENLKCSPLNESGNVLKLTEMMLASKKFVPASNERIGNLKVLVDDFTTKKNAEKIEEEISEFTKNRVFTDEEKMLIPKIEPWYIMPTQVLEICGLINKTTGTYKPKRNFMLRGPSSTGKTSMARAIAAKLGLPYVYITCSADTESSAFLGEPMYDEKGSVKYVESPFIRAIRNGWVVEVQEPYVIQKQGVLTSLNGLLDDGNGVTLATGEFIRRHPDAIVIFTTNVSYVGCKKPNQSVLRRMNNVYDVLMPSEKEIQERVIANTGFNDSRLLGKMIKCMSRINAHLQEEMIDDGVCGVSELIDWVSTVQVTKDIVGSANSTIVSKATDDINEQSAIASIIETQLSNDMYEG